MTVAKSSRAGGVSNFHDYVCQTLMETMRKPEPKENLDLKLSNPASITVR